MNPVVFEHGALQGPSPPPVLFNTAGPHECLHSDAVLAGPQRKVPAHRPVEVPLPPGPGPGPGPGPTLQVLHSDVADLADEFLPLEPALPLVSSHLEPRRVAAGPGPESEESRRSGGGTGCSLRDGALLTAASFLTSRGDGAPGARGEERAPGRKEPQHLVGISEVGWS